jgi:hypothetical protein
MARPNGARDRPRQCHWAGGVLDRADSVLDRAGSVLDRAGVAERACNCLYLYLQLRRWLRQTRENAIGAVGSVSPVSAGIKQHELAVE